MKVEEPQSTDAVLMIRPSVFLSNPETAATNEFQKHPAVDNERLQQQVRTEFDGVVERLRTAGVEVVVIEDTAAPPKPDAVFPNNWLTTHGDGQCIMYPMQPRSRRPERRPDILRGLNDCHGFHVRRIADWSDYERREIYLEGTGSIVMDRIHRRAYACRSPRTDERALRYFCEQFDYEPVMFTACGLSGRAIYHTNVMMCLGTRFVVICADAITDVGDREAVLGRLTAEREVVTISMSQMAQFAGNMLELRNAAKQTLLVMSERAHHALSAQQRDRLADKAQIIACDIRTIEDASGGGVRCMLAELFLPRRRTAA